MKRCNQCGRTYGDDSLRFCLDDGTGLVDVNEKPVEPPATVRYVDPPASTGAFHDAQITNSNYVATSELGRVRRERRRSNRSSNTGLTVAVIAIGLVLIALASIGVLLLWRQNQTTTQVTNPATPSTRSPEPSASTANTDQTDIDSTKGLNIKATASSVRLAVQSNTYLPGNAVDGSRKTAWIEGADGAGLGEWLRFDFGREINLHRMIVLPGYFKSPDIWKQNNRISKATLHFSNGTSRTIEFPDQMERQSIDLGSVKTRWVRLEIADVYPGSDPDTAISEVVFEWEP